MKTEIVKFNGNNLTCVVDDHGQILVVIKPICDALGLDNKRQIRTISDDDVLKPEVSEQTLQVGNDQPRKMICLPLEFINGWLFQVKFTNTMSDTTKQKLIEYKKQCYKVLFKHFFGSIKRQIESNKIEIQLLEEINELNEEKNKTTVQLREKKAKLDTIRKERLKNEPSLFD